jgi:hypothetical protein
MMGVDELLQVVDELSESDLDHLVDRALLARARRRASVLSAAETELFLKINQGIPEALHQEYLALVEKRDHETIAAVEYGRMLELGDQIDELAAERAAALSELAAIRQVPLRQLMDELGINGAGVR